MNKYTKIAIALGVLLVAYMVFVKKSDAAPIEQEPKQKPKPLPPVRKRDNNRPKPKPAEYQAV